MPRIQDHFLDCSVYFYDSVKSARDGKHFGGSGFLVHVPSDHEGWIHLYAVTNNHIVDNGFQVLRLNTSDGRVDMILSQPESWVHHPGGDDVCVLPIRTLGEQFKWFSVGMDAFITHGVITDYRIGPGDETFLIGRLVTAGGRQRNTPVVRFGNLSMMADQGEPIVLDNGHEQNSFLVECRSLSGFSGSPVFVWPNRSYHGGQIPKSLWPTPQPAQSATPPDHTSVNTGQRPATVTVTPVSISGTFGPWLLGIDFAHVPLWRPVYEQDHLTKTDYEVEANTGIACVIPAWRILDVLIQEDLVKQRNQDDKEISGRKRDATASGQSK